MRLRVVLGWLVGALTVACGGGGEVAEDRSPTIRLIEVDPPRILAEQDLFESSPVRKWTFDGPEADPRGWTISGEEVRTSATLEGMRLEARDSRVELSRSLDLRAGDFDAVEIEVVPDDTLETGSVRLTWGGPGSTPSKARELVARSIDLSETSSRVYRLRLKGHPEWSGPISRLRISFRHPPPGVIVRRIALVRESLDARALAALLESGIKAELGSELRNAIPGVPGMPIVWDLEVTAGAALRFSYGLPDTVSVPVSFRVSFVDEEQAPVEVFTRTLSPANSERWHEAQVSLADLAGRSGRLQLETKTQSAFDPIAGFPVWGNPRVSPAAQPERPNVVMISVDTLRADRLSLYGYERETSPNLDTWARRSAAVFRSAVVQAPWTLPSHVSMLTGLEAYRHGVHFYNMTIPRSLTFLAEILHEAGYSTKAVTGGGLLHPRYGFTQGFDRYWYYSGSRATGEELSQGMERVLEWLKEPPGHPFFLFIHTYEVHTPWRSRQPYFDRFSDLPAVQDMRVKNPDPDPEEGFLGRNEVSDINLHRPKLPVEPTEAELVELANAAYDSGIAYTDKQLGRLFELLARHELDGDTIVVVTSDHGELLGEYGVIGHRYFYEQNTLVPLIIAAPGGRGAGVEIDSQVRSIDIVPTVLELVGLQATEDIDGESLVPLLDGGDRDVRRQAWTYSPGSNHGIAVRVDGRYKYVFNDTAWPQLLGTEAAYALEPIAQEDRNILSSFEGSERLRAAARKRVAVAPGLRLRFVTGPERAVRGHLRGPAVRPNRVKSSHLPCACLRYDQGRANFDVPEGQDFTVIVLGSGSKPSTLDLEDAEGSPRGRFRHRIGPVGSESAIGERRIIALTDAGWREVRPPVEFDTFVEIWWEGAFATSPESSLEGDEKLKEQLRALGYVE